MSHCSLNKWDCVIAFPTQQTLQIAEAKVNSPETLAVTGFVAHGLILI